MEKAATVYRSPKDLHTYPGLEHFKPRTMRHLIYKADKNGLAASGALVRLGGKILIDVARFLEFINQHRVQQ